MAYATPDDVYGLGLSAQAFVRVARPLDKYDANHVDLATGTIRLTAHGLSAFDLVDFEVVSGGALPPEVGAFASYSPVIVGANLFRLVGVSAFSLIGSGWRVGVDPLRRLQMHLDVEAATIDEHLTAEAPPIKVDPTTGLYPRILVKLNARMAARAAVTSLQIDNAAYRVAVDRIFAQEAEDKVLLADWKNGKPINVRPPDQTATHENGAHAGSRRATAGWQRPRCIL